MYPTDHRESFHIWKKDDRSIMKKMLVSDLFRKAFQLFRCSFGMKFIRRKSWKYSELFDLTNEISLVNNRM